MMNTDERTELIAAWQHTAFMVEGLLGLLEELLVSVETQAPPSAERVEEIRRHTAVWRTQLERMRQRLTSATIEPPERSQ